MEYLLDSTVWCSTLHCAGRLDLPIRHMVPRNTSVCSLVCISVHIRDRRPSRHCPFHRRLHESGSHLRTALNTTKYEEDKVMNYDQSQTNVQAGHVLEIILFTLKRKHQFIISIGRIIL